MTFACGAAGAMTGADPSAEHRGRYSTQIGAFRLLKRLGSRGVEEHLDKLYPRIAPAMAQRGDIVLHQNAAGVAFGAVGLFVGEAGLLRVPMREWTGAWAVGRAATDG